MSDQFQIEPVSSSAQVALVEALAREIWYEHYVPLIGREQVDYMVVKFQSAAAIVGQIEAGFEYFLVRYEHAPVGYFAIQAQTQEGGVFISKFYLHGSCRGRGTGRRCMEFIEQLASGRGLVLLWLTVNKANPSVKAYQRLGFRIAAEIEIDIGSGFAMNDFRMEKQLAPAPLR
jgi:diamine N-acetyltransferase